MSQFIAVESSAPKTIRLHRNDDVLIARSQLLPGKKIATNTALWRRQEEDMDLNCGTILDGERTIEEVRQDICTLMIAAASGEKTKSERHGYGQNEFVPWQIGALT